MRTTLCRRSFAAGAVTALKNLGAQLLVIIVFGASAIAFGAGVANAEHGRIGPWPGDGYGFGPYVVAPEPTNASEEEPASSDDATWPPTGASWPPGGSRGDSGGSTTPIVMPDHQSSTAPAASAE
jgi:hypothetical protein